MYKNMINLKYSQFESKCKKIDIIGLMQDNDLNHV